MERAMIEKALVAIILIVLLLMHILGAAILLRSGASADGPAEPQRPPQLYE
jgi:flagellar basal body-associated protein FliL